MMKYQNCYFSNPVLQVWRVESLSEESHITVVVFVDLKRKVHQLQPHVHQPLVSNLILGALLGGEGTVLQVGVHQVHLQYLQIFF